MHISCRSRAPSFLGRIIPEVFWGFTCRLAPFHFHLCSPCSGHGLRADLLGKASEPAIDPYV